MNDFEHVQKNHENLSRRIPGTKKEKEKNLNAKDILSSNGIPTLNFQRYNKLFGTQ